MHKLEEMASKYAQKFGEPFPIEILHTGDDNALSVAEQCLKDGKPYVMEYEDGVDYSPQILNSVPA